MQDQRATTPISIGFVSLGCAKNRVDGQIMAGLLVERGMKLAPDPETADVVIVNTCAFIADAREESLATIAEVCEWKRLGRCRAILVAGCLPQRYRDQVQSALPDVDGFIGLDAIDTIADAVAALVSGKHNLLNVPVRSERLFDPPAIPVVFSDGAYAYLKIAEGCDHRCAFCAIPAIRGRFRSRPVDSLAREAANLVSQGFRELDIIAQDITAYGCDRNDSIDLACLLEALDAAVREVTDDVWLRLLYGYPTGITPMLLETMARLPTVVPYLDVPVQHSHPNILKSMRRGNTTTAVVNLAAQARATLPDITLRTTCLTGFPGETETHMAHLLDYIETNRFDHVGVFVWSPEADTGAVNLPNAPSPEVANERRERLLEVQRRIVTRKHATLIHSHDRLLLDGPTSETGLWRARSRRQAPEADGVTWLSDTRSNLKPGLFVDAVYTEIADTDLVAVPVSP